MKRSSRAGRLTQLERNQRTTGIFFILPSLVLCAIFMVVPLINVIRYSLTDWDGLSKTYNFVGLYNYMHLHEIEGFGEMMLATVTFAIGVTAITIIVSFLAALALDKRGRDRLPRGLMRALWFFPALLSGAVVGILWRMRCIQVCEKVQGMGVWTLIGSGYRTTIGLKDNQPFSESDCALCGQCITHCPVGALRERDDRLDLNDALADPEIVTIVQVAPAVRTAWGEQIGLKDKDATMGKLVCALKKIGIDYVFDTNYSADLTIMEEGSEFLERLANRNRHKWPMFTSCCPGWLRFVRTQYPDMVEDLSTAKSPQQMFGAISKTYIAQKLGLDPAKIFSVSIMPCVAKKFECDVEQVNDAGRGKDVDLVLTTRELDRLIRCDSIKPQDLMDVPFDDIFGEGSGAAVIFGTTGGVMEAALRSAYYLVTGSNPDPDAFKEVRGMNGWKEAKFDLAGTTLKVAVASGLGNARKLIDAVNRGDVEYDFVEIMACPGGCVGGGGQPFVDGEEFAPKRALKLYGLDKVNHLRFSHENQAVQQTYQEYLGKPLSKESHHLLHTHLADWDLEMKPLNGSK